jgi:hypothetical protein
MVNALDDPRPPRPAADLKERVIQEGARRLRRRHVTVTAVAASAIVAVAVGFALTGRPARHSQSITIGPGPSTTSTATSGPLSPTVTTVKNTVIRYWGPITAADSDDQDLQLAVPPVDAKPTIPWQQAAEPCNVTTGTNNCARPTIAEDVFLASGTEFNSGDEASGGSIVPVMDHTLVYVIAENLGACLSAVPAGPASPPTTATDAVHDCIYLDFVDANTGRSLFAMDGGNVHLPPHA